jgi:hypothetical protein
MKKVAAIALAVVAMIGSPLRGSPKTFSLNGQQTEPNTISWTNGGGSFCLTVLTVDGQPAPGGYVYCPYQSTSFNLPDGKASLYLPDSDPGEFGVILEDIILTTGNIVPTSYNKDGSLATYSRTDTFSEYGWTGTTTQNYAISTSIRCTRVGCHKYSQVAITGGAGTITEM